MKEKRYFADSSRCRFRSARGSAMSEFGPGLLIILCLGFFPMLDFISIGLQYGACWYLNFLQVREAAVTIKVNAGQVDPASKAAAENRLAGIRKQWADSGIGKFCRVDNNKPFKESIEVDSSGGAAATFANVSTDVSCFPFLPIPFIPGLSDSFSFKFRSDRLIENSSSSTQ